MDIALRGPFATHTPFSLEFRSNNEYHRPVVEALDLVKRYTNAMGLRSFPAEENVPIEGVVSGLWREAVMEPSVPGDLLPVFWSTRKFSLFQQCSLE